MSKLLITALGIGVAALALLSLKNDKPVVEGFWGGTQFTTRAMPAARLADGREVAIGGNYLNPNTLGSGKFVSVPNFQAVLSPRFSNLSYGANIRYNMPDRENMAVPCEPLTFGSMATTETYLKPNPAAQEKLRQNNPIVNPQNLDSKENYCSSCTSTAPPSCGKGGYGFGNDVAGGYELPSGYANGNYWDTYNSIPSSAEVIGSDLPIGTMSTVDGAGNQDQFIAFNRIMPANTKSTSRLRAQGDYIRGDLPIVPCQSGWFSVYPDISRDLNEGAMNVLAGAGGGGDSYNQLMNLIVTASGGSQTALGGVNLKEALPSYNAVMAGESLTSLKSAMGDIQVSSFP